MCPLFYKYKNQNHPVNLALCAILMPGKAMASHNGRKCQSLKDYRDHDFPNTEFSYFLTIDTRQQELSNYLLKMGVTGH